jgi:hypothetical protein
MSDVMRQRRAGDQAVAEKHDTERYLVVCFPSRAAREAALTAIGLPHDERYVLSDAVELRIKDGKRVADALVLASRRTKAADLGNSGAGG